jgi:hypothetical protein
MPALGSRTTMSSRPTYHARTVIAGGGEALTTTLERLAVSRPPGKTLIINDQPNWMTRFPRHHELGQSRRALSTRPAESFDQPDQRMRVEEYMNELVSRQIQAVGQFGDDELDLHVTAVRSVRRDGGRVVRVTCTDDSVVTCDQLVLCTGVGPERPLHASGVTILNTPTGGRVVQEEVTTALRAVERGRTQFQGSRVIVYGGGATAAWVCEVLFEYGVGGLLWVGRNFDAANPNDRNSDVMERTEGHRLVAEMASVEYRGPLDQPTTDPGLLVTLTGGNGARVVSRAHYVIAATGADPLQPTGARAVLGSDIYRRLEPICSPNGGVVAATPDRAVIVTSTPLNNSKLRGPIESHTFPAIEPENRVLAGIKVTRLSAEAAADLVADPPAPTPAPAGGGGDG